MRIAEKPVGEMRPGDHAAFSFTVEEQQARVIAPFVRDGLQARHKVIYVNAGDAGGLPGLHSSADVDRAAATGQLRLIPQTAVCLTRGRFDPDRMRTVVGQEIIEAIEHGYPAVRLTADMSWVLDGGDPDGVHRLLASEASFDEAMEHGLALMAICRLNASRCPPDQLSALTDVHPLRVTPDPEFDDGVLRIVRSHAPTGLRLVGELDAVRHGPFVAALTSLGERNADIHLDFAGVRFVDLATLNLLVTHAMRMHPGGAMVLDNLPPDAADVIETLGWRYLPGLTRGRSRQI
jgi:anti-anti-sigma regulatory factor